MVDGNLVERVLNAKSFSDCLESWQKCRLEDVLVFELSKRLGFAIPNKKQHEQVTEFENLWFTRIYSDHDREIYARHVLIDFLKFRLALKRKQLEKKLIVKDVLRTAGGFALFFTATGGLAVVPPAYFAGAFIGWLGIAGLGYLNIRQLRKKRKNAFAQNYQITAKDTRLFRDAKNFDTSIFWKKYRDYFAEKIQEYSTMLNNYRI